jgi:hypothetical protein
MNADQTRDFFDKYKVAVDEYNIEKENIWIMDETVSGMRDS